MCGVHVVGRVGLQFKASIVIRQWKDIWPCQGSRICAILRVNQDLLYATGSVLCAPRKHAYVFSPEGSIVKERIEEWI